MKTYIVSGTVEFTIKVEAESEQEARDMMHDLGDIDDACSNKIAERDYEVLVVKELDGDED